MRVNTKSVPVQKSAGTFGQIFVLKAAATHDNALFPSSHCHTKDHFGQRVVEFRGNGFHSRMALNIRGGSLVRYTSPTGMGTWPRSFSNSAGER